ncbi:MAG: FAD-linked oxidase C-terminal domain-containing protein [Pseudomonadota bacterium]
MNNAAHAAPAANSPVACALSTALDVLRQRFGQQLQQGEALRTQHAHSTTWIAPEPPDAVLFAEGEADVRAAVEICATYDVPVIPFGAGTSLEGQVNAARGGLSIDLSRMNRIIAVNTDDLDCVVEPGVTRKQLNDHLRDLGLFFSVDPGAEDATLGGMAATRASGTMAVRYGTMRENVINLRAVLADGRVISTARRARKSSAGYDLTHLFVGSEGTLGVTTELTVRVHGIPEATLAAVCPFETVDGACTVVIQAIQLGLGLARVELLDEIQVRACNAYSGLAMRETPTLFLEFHGTEQSVREQVESFRDLASAEGAGDLEWATETEQRNRLWKARHDAYWAGRALRPGSDALATDVCVPISSLAACVRETREDIDRLGLLAPIVGHVGDGNFHVLPLLNMNDAGERARVEEFVMRLGERALRFDGTCTGEHGIGTGKKKLLRAEHGEGVDVMQTIKQALDPNDLFNPGKIFPT